MKYVFIALFIVLLVVFLYLQNNIIDITRYRLKSEKIINKIRIVHLSDLHSKPSKKVLEKTDSERPDLILITGDYIDDKCRNKEKMYKYAKELCKLAPVYYITGNHERRLENFDEVMQGLRDCGFNVILNDIEQITVNETPITILGLNENQGDFEDYKARKRGTYVYQDMSPYFNELDKYDGYKIVLSHFPENFEGIKELNYSQYDIDLQLSGHAHGGQFILPFIGPVFSPGQGIHPKYARGSFGEKPMMIVSRGIGNSEFPFRLFNHPEIITITLSRKI